MRITLLIIALLIALFIWNNFVTPKTTGLVNGKLHPCPKSPNCVNCQQSDSKHYIAPLPLIPGKSFDFIEGFFKQNYNAITLVKTPTYMHLVAITKICRFRDDVEFLIENNEICVRSASRVGYGDGGVNRARIESLRAAMIQN